VHPVCGLQLPTRVWHWSDGAHVTAPPPVHAPFWHVSFCVHAFPSLHDVPLAAAGFEHVPVLVLHVPAVWHASLAVHVMGFAPVHVPFWQLSLCVHALPSLQAVPLAATGFEQVPDVGSHVPAT
jgi:hypothetical protein